MKALLAIAALAALAAPAAANTCRDPKSVVEQVTLDGTRVTECFEGGRRACWRLELATPTWEPSPVPALGACGMAACDPAAARSTIPSAAIVTACAPDGSACHTVATPRAIGLAAVTDGALVAAIEDERITIADVRTGMVAATIVPWSHPRDNVLWSFRGEVRFVGRDYLVVELGDGGTLFARVFTARTGAVALELPGGFDSAPSVALGDELALAVDGGTALVLADPKRATRRSIPLFAAPARLALFAATPRAIVAVQDSGNGTLAIVDGKTTRLVPGPPICP